MQAAAAAAVGHLLPRQQLIPDQNAPLAAQPPRLLNVAGTTRPVDVHRGIPVVLILEDVGGEPIRLRRVRRFGMSIAATPRMV